MVEIWLEASLLAHDFIAAAYWQGQVDAMRDIYLPQADSVVLESEERICGFLSLVDTRLAALFVHPHYQRKGFGALLLGHAQQQRLALELAVYEQNRAATAFYERSGFRKVQKRPDAATGHEEWLMRWEFPSETRST